MRIGELARRSGLTASRIRFYEAEGLIQAVARSANNYRAYGPEALSVLQIIASAQGAGFSLDEIRHLLPVEQGAWQHDELLAGLRRKVSEIESLQQRLAHNRAQLLAVVESLESGPADMACAERTQWVMQRLREKGMAQEGTGPTPQPLSD